MQKACRFWGLQMQGLENLGQYPKNDFNQICFGIFWKKQSLLPWKINLNGSGLSSKFVGYYLYQTSLLCYTLSLFQTDITRFFCWKSRFYGKKCVV